jgi:hypothetical protein
MPHEFSDASCCFHDQQHKEANDLREYHKYLSDEIPNNVHSKTARGRSQKRAEVYDADGT